MSTRTFVRRATRWILSGLAAGALVSCGGGKDSTGPDDHTTQQPVLQLSASQATFEATLGSADPAAQTFAVTASNGNAGALNAKIAYAAGQQGGWLTAGLDGVTTPATLSVRASSAGLAAGDYTATVSITSSAGDKPMAVTFHVHAAPVTYSLTTSAAPAAGGRVVRTPDQASYSAGSSVSLQAEPNRGWGFTGWSGDLTSTANPVNVTMNAARTITAGFGVLAPTLAAPTVSGSTVSLSWTFEWPCGPSGCLVSTNDYYEVEESTTSSTGGFTSVYRSPANTHASPATTTLTRGAGTYYYRVRAFTMYGLSAYSAVGSVTVTEQPPAAPTGLTATAISSSRIDLAWSNAATNETGTVVERCTGVGCTSFADVATLGANATSFSSTRLAAGTSYSFRVRNVNAAGSSSPSNVATAVTPASTGTTRFVNNAVWAIVSLQIDGVEWITQPGTGIAAGSSATLTLPLGLHQYRVVTGTWNGTTRFEVYWVTGSFTQLAGTTGTVTIDDPTIAQILTSFSTSRLWDGEFFDANTTLHVAGFRFFNDGTCRLYVDGLLQTSCTFALVSYVPGTITFRVRYASGTTYDGVLDELGGFFYMNNGPASWRTIKYTNSGQP